MKNKLLALILLGSTGSTFAQTFNDDFESYTAGAYLGPQSGGAWTTWSNAPGTTEDVYVSSADAASGSKSLYFSSTSASGGPTDLVRNFGVLNTGQFTMEFNMKVNNGKAGYFNLQRNATIGQVWAMDCFFKDNGTILINNQQGLSFTGSYPQGVWFNYRLEINFNTNVWEVFIDNASQGTFSNANNQIASIDIFPLDSDAPNDAQYYIDDFSTTITPYTLPNLNAAANLVSFSGANLAGSVVTPKVTVRNLGTTTLNSFDLTVDYNGTQINHSVTGQTLASLATIEITMPGTLTLAAGSLPMIASVSNPNAGADMDANDDEVTLMVNPIVPAAGKMVVSEEATGTWCGWCPRGAVSMENMENKYSAFWAGIAVHNGDPMTDSTYDAGIAPLIGGYPSALVDRVADIDPTAMEADFLNRIQVAPVAFIENGATFNATTRVLNVSATVDFQQAASSSYKMAIVLTEDDVTGTVAGYNQANYYSGGGSGVMGGFETLSNPVPAAQMVYTHVARVIAPSFGGAANSFPTTVAAGSTHIVNANFILPVGWDENEIHIVSMLIDPTGKIDNAGKATIAEAVSNGLENGTVIYDETLSVEEMNQIDATLSIYPNPTAENATVVVQLPNQSNVELRLVDMNGKVLVSRDYGSLSGATTINVNTTMLEAGTYTIELVLDSTVVKRRFVKL